MKMAVAGLALALFSALVAPAGAHGAALASAALAVEEPEPEPSMPSIAPPSERDMRREFGMAREEWDAALADIPRAPTLKYSLICVAGFTLLGLAIIGTVLCILQSGPGHKSSSGSAKTPEPSPRSDLEDGEEPDDIDYEALVKALLERAVHIVGPKVAKGQAAKRIVQERCDRILKKSTAFVMDEFVATLGRMFKALDAEEAMLLLDWRNESSSADFPAIPLLLAGLLSPMVLNVSVWVHVIQVVAIFIPIFVLCVASSALDFEERCGIPGIFIWCYIMLLCSLVMGIAHAQMAKQIIDGKSLMAAKIDVLQKRTDAMANKEPHELTPADVREVFVCAAVILEQGLMVEDEMRKSKWNNVLGVGSVVWLFICMWTYFIVFRWVFVPGMVAFHKSAHEVSGNEYCGATATVFTANFTCLLCVLFVTINTIAVLKWLSDRHINNPVFQRLMLNRAKAIDTEMLGLPLASLVVKAFFLRGGTDLLSSHLDQVQAQRCDLEEEHKKKKARLDEIDGKIQQAKEQALLAKEAEIGSNMSPQLGRSKTQAAGEELDNQVAMLQQTAESTLSSLESSGLAQDQLSERRKEAQAKLDAALGQLGNVMESLVKTPGRLRRSATAGPTMSPTRD
jgi:hypothetical protein